MEVVPLLPACKKMVETTTMEGCMAGEYTSTMVFSHL